MKTKLTLITAMLFISLQTFSQAPVWVWAKSAVGTGFDYTQSVTTDVLGNVYVAGYFNSDTITFGSITLPNSSVDTADIFIAKYDATGNVLWAKKAGGTNNDVANSIATDGSGNVYVTGNFASDSITFGTTTLTNAGGGAYDVFIAKFDDAGNALWAKGSGGTDYDLASSVTTDFSGNEYVTGYFQSDSVIFGATTLTNASVGYQDIFLVKYNSAGTVLWAKSFGGTGHDVAKSGTSDALGDVYLAGQFYSDTLTFGTTILINASTDTGDVFIAKYDADGNSLWAESAGGIENDGAASVTIDGLGNVYVAGDFLSSSITFGATTLTNASSGYYDMFLAKYDADGNVLWAKRAGGTDGDGANSVTTDVPGNVYVAGDFYSSSIEFGTNTLTNAGAISSSDIFLAKYDSSGNPLWAKSAGGADYDYSTSVTNKTEGGIVYAVGYFFSSSISFGSDTLTNSGSTDVFLAKLDTLTIAGNNEIVKFDKGIFLFPNPTTNYLTIALVSKSEKVKVIITDITGRIIYTTSARETQMIDVSTKDFGEGIYCVRIQSTDFVETKKIIVQK